jgi:hypothetical protein
VASCLDEREVAAPVLDARQLDDAAMLERAARLGAGEDVEVRRVGDWRLKQARADGRRSKP